MKSAATAKPGDDSRLFLSLSLQSINLHSTRAVAVLLCACLVWLSPVWAEESSSLIGRQTVGMVVGGMLPARVMDGQSSKLNGVAVHPSWQIALTDPLGDGWWRGSVALGVEAALLGITQPTGAYGVGITPKLIYTLASFGRLKPYLEGGGGPLWTNFDGRIPEQGSDFNFLVWGGTGATYDLTARWALNAGLRFSHTSNGGTDPSERRSQLPAAVCRNFGEALLTKLF